MTRITKRMRTSYVPRPDRAVRLSSAVRIASWAAHSQQLYAPHQRELLSIACWKASELDGKWNTRFRSAAVVEGSLGTPVHHEHAVTRRSLVGAMLAHPEECEVLLATSSETACIVTRKEHDRMHDDHFGWRRYIEAEIEVVDLSSGELVDLGAQDARVRSAIFGLME